MSRSASWSWADVLGPPGEKPRPVIARIRVWVCPVDQTEWIGPYSHRFRDNEQDLIGRSIQSKQPVIIPNTHPMFLALSMALNNLTDNAAQYISTSVPDQDGVMIEYPYIYNRHESGTFIRGVLAEQIIMEDPKGMAMD